MSRTPINELALFSCGIESITPSGLLSGLQKRYVDVVIQPRGLEGDRKCGVHTIRRADGFGYRDVK